MLQGFMHKLFETKWAKYTRIHYAHRLLDVVLLASILALAVDLKAHPAAHATGSSPMVYWLLLLLAVHAVIELVWMRLFHGNQVCNSYVTVVELVWMRLCHGNHAWTVTC